MKKGPSIYFATDKNIFDALNQSKIDNDTVQGMFRRRNMVSSKLTKREDLANFFSRLTHDLIDHRDLSDKLGVQPRRDRMTVVDMVGAQPPAEALQQAIEAVKAKIVRQDDVALVHIDGSNVSITVKYSVIDYKRSEFSQLQHRSGLIELIQQKGRLVVRSTKTDHIDAIRDDLIRQIEAETNHPILRREISLFHHPDPSSRSKFFYDLTEGLHGYQRRDVTDVFVYKPRPGVPPDDIGDDEESGEPHIERIFLKGSRVSRSKLLADLISGSAYYIAKVCWLSVASLGNGAGFELEATFNDPLDCTGFSYMLKGVYDLGEDGKLVKHRRSPTREEVNIAAMLIENRARELTQALDNEDALNEQA